MALIGGTIQAGSPFSSSTPLPLSNAVTFTNSVVGFAGADPITFKGTVTLNGANNLLSVASGSQATFSGQVTGAANLSKLGAGTLFLTNAVGAASNYTGQTTIVAGFLNVQNGNATTAAPLGANTTVVVASGGTLQLQAMQPVSSAATAAPGFSVARPIVLYGNGAAGNGALESVFGVNIVSGTIALNTAATIGVDASMLTQPPVIAARPT